MNDFLTVIQTFGINGFPHGTDKTTDHSYEQIYPDLLAPFRYAPCTLLEIGVQSGGSLVLWQHYLSDVTIYGIDRHYAVTHHNRELLLSNDGQLFIGDAYSVARHRLISSSTTGRIRLRVNSSRHGTTASCSHPVVSS